MVLNGCVHQGDRIIFIQGIHILIITPLLDFHHRNVGHNPEHAVHLRSNDPGIVFKHAGQDLHLILRELSGAVKVVFAIFDLFRLRFFLYLGIDFRLG